MKYILFLFLALHVEASMLDFIHIEKAKHFYANKHYKEAQKEWLKVDKDSARYDAANSLYRQKKYKEALDIYKTIKDKKLAFQKLHNMGNCYAKMHKFEDAIKSYEKALKIRQDKDTKFNLDLLKKLQKNKQKQNKKQQNKSGNSKKNNKNQKNKSSKKQKDAKQGKNKQDGKNNNPKKTNQTKKNKNSNQKNSKTALKEAFKKQKPISDMEERKWQEILNKRGVNTLMLPIKKGEDDNEKNPW